MESAALVAVGGAEAENAGGPSEECHPRTRRVRLVALCSSLFALASAAMVCWRHSAMAATVTMSSGLKGGIVQESGSSFDGCWRAQSAPSEAQAIKKGKVYWEGGAITDVHQHPTGTLRMTLHGYSYSAVLRSQGKRMRWNDGDVWELIDGSHCGDGSGSGSSSKDPIKQGPEPRDLEVHKLLNEMRMKGWTCKDGTHGPQVKRKFKFDCRLWKASKLHAMDMEKHNFFNHVNLQNEDSDARAKKQGYHPNTAENIHMGSMTAQEALDSWTDSLGHCKNMQRNAYMHATAFHAYIAVMNMGDGDEPADRSCLPADSDVY